MKNRLWELKKFFQPSLPNMCVQLLLEFRDLSIILHMYNGNQREQHNPKTMMGSKLDIQTKP